MRPLGTPIHQNGCWLVASPNAEGADRPCANIPLPDPPQPSLVVLLRDAFALSRRLALPEPIAVCLSAATQHAQRPVSLLLRVHPGLLVVSANATLSGLDHAALVAAVARRIEFAGALSANFAGSRLAALATSVEDYLAQESRLDDRADPRVLRFGRAGSTRAVFIDLDGPRHLLSVHLEDTSVSAEWDGFVASAAVDTVAKLRILVESWLDYGRLPASR